MSLLGGTRAQVIHAHRRKETNQVSPSSITSPGLIDLSSRSTIQLNNGSRVSHTRSCERLCKLRGGAYAVVRDGIGSSGSGIRARSRAVLFFVESGFATGAILTVDGGRLIAWRDQQFFQDCSYPSMTTRNQFC